MKENSPTDSPWFWVYLFATCALTGLLIIQPKFQQRQTGIEQKGEARREINQQKEQPAVTQTETQQTTGQQNNDQRLKTIGLQPLILILGIAICGGWTLFWLQRMNRRSARILADAPNNAANTDSKLSDQIIEKQLTDSE